ncbi:hypothetical protein SG34_011625 [Thalassomonas viridans]|uniref:Uncharacterized protein n=1 Tax=Thalassomonas viridans TaxID=137584 RepID=A0AAE9Z6F7_9GAMM|nr:hypothetical protein [Thalassomonas viridans]WDE07473.1 hypothetical protein SG34_011625 [Thalassomonas viridans]
MINLRSSSLVLAMAVVGLTFSAQASALSAEPVVSAKAIKIKAGEGNNATIVADINGENFRVELPKEALHDKEALEASVAGLPEEVRETLLSTLSDIELGEHMVKVKQVVVDTKGSAEGLARLHVSGESGEERVIVVDIDKDELAAGHYKFFESIDGLSGNKFSKVISGDHAGKVIGKDTIIRLLAAAELTPQELDEIQQALDDKR